MKSHTNYLIVLTLAFAVAMTAPIAYSIEIKSYYANIDAIIANGKPQSVIPFMESLNEVDQISLGGGIGPVDRSYLRWQFVSISWPLLTTIDRHGYDVDLNDLSPWTLAVISAAAPHKIATSEDIMNFLRSDEPSIRWIGLEIIERKPDLIDSEIEATVNAIITTDPFIVILKTPIGPEQGRPSPPGSVRNVFRAPLREKASRLLKVEKTPLLREQVDKAGIDHLIKFSKINPAMERDIIEAIGMLHSSGETITNAQAVLRDNPSLQQLEVGLME